MQASRDLEGTLETESRNLFGICKEYDRRLAMELNLDDV